jgi:capsular exopolysaccharide synthesis family protein
MILHNLTVEEAVQVVDDHLHILTSGTKLPYPAEFLMSDKLKELIECLKGKYDKIIIDTPPMTAVTDANIISSLVDGVVIVFAAREAKIDVASRVIKDLKDNGANIIGSVMTRVKKKEHHYAYYYYAYGKS